MPESENSEIDLDSLDVGLECMSVSGSDDVLVQWRRSDMEGVIGDACVIEKALAEFVEESHDIGLADEEDEEDNTNIDDGYVAPVDSSRDANDDDFFKLRRDMAAEKKDQDMIDEARKYFKSKCFRSEQIKYLSTLFLTDNGKFNFFDAAYLHVSDQDKFKGLESEMKDAYYINRFKALVGN